MESNGVKMDIGKDPILKRKTRTLHLRRGHRG